MILDIPLSIPGLSHYHLSRLVQTKSLSMTTTRLGTPEVARSCQVDTYSITAQSMRWGINRPEGFTVGRLP